MTKYSLETKLAAVNGYLDGVESFKEGWQAGAERHRQQHEDHDQQEDPERDPEQPEQQQEEEVTEPSAPLTGIKGNGKNGEEAEPEAVLPDPDSSSTAQAINTDWHWSELEIIKKLEIIQTCMYNLFQGGGNKAIT